MTKKVMERLEPPPHQTPTQAEFDVDEAEKCFADDSLRGEVSVKTDTSPTWEFRPLPDEYSPTTETCESCKGKGCNNCGSLGYVFHYKRRGDTFIVGKGWL
jgi:hypothetical protein